ILAAMALVMVILSRLFMLNAAAIGERKVIFFQTWKWTSGNVLRVIAAIIITDLPAFVIMQILSGLAYESVTAGGAITNATAYAAWGAVLQFVAAMTGIPLIALGAHLYKGLRPPDFAAK
ncbi:MAG TPA: hypothetical protein VG942_10645, partial [Hyphomonadaceae bacterium]|nr:hypothetical protein [Hyphomonadaceae bacterium]